jgi:gluconate 5-dehydrogenase
MALPIPSTDTYPISRWRRTSLEISKEFNLQGKVALVAGDSRYWSKTISVALAEAGADVAIAAKNQKKLDEAARVVQQAGRKAVSIKTDVSSSSDVEKMLIETIKDLGKVDIMVLAHDRVFAKPFLDITGDEWQKVVNESLQAAFNCCRTVGRYMVKQKHGRIINITNGLAERGLPNSSAYCVAMGGILQLTRALALEWAPDRIAINAIGPLWFSDKEKTGMKNEDLLLHNLPLKRYGRPEEISSLVVYLASDVAEYFTGQFVCVDGAASVRCVPFGSYPNATAGLVPNK